VGVGLSTVRSAWQTGAVPSSGDDPATAWEGRKIMSDQIKSAIAKSAPWRKGTPWWLILVEGVILLAIGIFMLVQPVEAAAAFVLLLGGFLLINSLLRLFHGLYKLPEGADARLLMMRGGVGLVTGILVVASPFFEQINLIAAGIILGVGLLLSGLIGLVNIFLMRSGQATTWGIVLADLVEVVLAVIVFYELNISRASESTLTILGIAFILAIYAVLVGRSTKA
jgi:uncharacterized membrane protein HdeD (DUF308 family)